MQPAHLSTFIANVITVCLEEGSCDFCKECGACRGIDISGCEEADKKSKRGQTRQLSDVARQKCAPPSISVLPHASAPLCWCREHSEPGKDYHLDWFVCALYRSPTCRRLTLLGLMFVVDLITGNKALYCAIRLSLRCRHAWAIGAQRRTSNYATNG